MALFQCRIFSGRSRLFYWITVPQIIEASGYFVTAPNLVGHGITSDSDPPCLSCATGARVHHPGDLSANGMLSLQPQFFESHDLISRSQRLDTRSSLT